MSSGSKIPTTKPARAGTAVDGVVELVIDEPDEYPTWLEAAGIAREDHDRQELRADHEEGADAPQLGWPRRPPG